MKVHYIDEYHELLHTVESDMVPRANEVVILNDEEHRVRSVHWNIDQNDVVVEITQNLVRTKEEDKTDGRLNEAKSAIVNLTERVESAERRGRILADQVVRIKTRM